MGWSYWYIPKHQRLHRWRLGMDKEFHPTHNNACNYLSTLGLNLNHVNKRATGQKLALVRVMVCRPYGPTITGNDIYVTRPGWVDNMTIRFGQFTWLWSIQRVLQTHQRYLWCRRRAIWNLRNCINWLWPSGAIWWHRVGPTLAHLMACCLKASSHMLPEPVLTFHRRCTVAFILDQFHKSWWT